MRTSEVVKGCLRAAVEGPFFPDWEFETLFGVERDVVAKVYRDWPEKTVGEADFDSAVIGALGNLLAYPHRQEDILESYTSVSVQDIRIALDDILNMQR